MPARHGQDAHATVWFLRSKRDLHPETQGICFARTPAGRFPRLADILRLLGESATAPRQINNGTFHTACYQTAQFLAGDYRHAFSLLAGFMLAGLIASLVIKETLRRAPECDDAKG